MSIGLLFRRKQNLRGPPADEDRPRHLWFRYRLYSVVPDVKRRKRLTWLTHGYAIWVDVAPCQILRRRSGRRQFSILAGRSSVSLRFSGSGRACQALSISNPKSSISVIRVTDQSLCTIENLARMRVDSKPNSDVTLDPSGESPSFKADRNAAVRYQRLAQRAPSNWSMSCQITRIH